MQKGDQWYEKKTVQKSSTKGNAKSSTKSNARNSVKSSAKNSAQKAVKTVAPTVENVSVKQAVIIQEPFVEQNEQNMPTRQPDLGPRRSVAFIGSECYPFVKTGGLGDVMSALPKSLAKLNIGQKAQFLQDMRGNRKLCVWLINLRRGEI